MQGVTWINTSMVQLQQNYLLLGVFRAHDSRF